ncbi:hypothetical protein AA0117_g12311 [Alternaria alternata]|uniref:Apple domain-containing protein n=1 Tax=Alternaria alternata TaxID=5599 RepID=A0A4Q4N0X3_ALTAL|nr:hypothetical protein AA0117_g12311 [Alternaria alternata]
MVFSHLAAFGSALAPSRSPVRSFCDSLPLGHGTPILPDTPEAFQAYAPFAGAALSATTPAGYIQSYANLLTTYDTASQFVHYISMDEYNVEQCAHACNSDDNCNAFTIFFERQPVVSPAPELCPNPPSTTIIKCDLWSSTILPDIAINHGQLREQFHVVMAGSNAYVKDINGTTPSVSDDYTIEKYDMGAAIEAPLDCNGEDTYMGLKHWSDGHFDAQRCMDVCKETHDASGRQCRFANTYMQRRNNVPTDQHCDLFSKYWPTQYATNIGQRRGSSNISISSTDSYGIRDITDDFSACLPGNDSASVPSSTLGDLEGQKATTLTTRTRSQIVWATHPSSKSFTYPVIAPESFSDWDPVKETTTYTTPAASAFSSDFTSAVVAPETFSDWDPVLETGTYVKRQLVIPTDVPVVIDVPDLLEVFSDIATRQ